MSEEPYPFDTYVNVKRVGTPDHDGHHCIEDDGAAWCAFDGEQWPCHAVSPTPDHDGHTIDLGPVTVGAASSKQDARRITAAFLNRARTERLAIAARLGVGADLDAQTPQAADRIILARVRETGQIGALCAALGIAAPVTSSEPPTPSGGDETGDEVRTDALSIAAKVAAHDVFRNHPGAWYDALPAAVDAALAIAALRATDGDDEWVQVGWGGPSWDDALEVHEPDDCADLDPHERIVREGGDAWVVDFGDWCLVHEDGSAELVEPWPIYARRSDVPGEALRESDRG